MTGYEKLMSIIAVPEGWLLTLIYNFVSDYGLTLIIFTLLIRGCLLPLYATQIKGSMKMQDIQPKMMEIQRRYANDRAMMSQKLSELYKEEKYNPMSGCLPMIIQMIIIMPLFFLLRDPMLFINNQSMLMGVHESFLWIEDMSQPDSWILPVAAGVATFVSYSLTMSMSPNVNGTMGMMKVMSFFFPIMIFWMARSFPAGLALYWFVGTCFMIVQTLIMKKYRKNLKEKKKVGKAVKTA